MKYLLFFLFTLCVFTQENTIDVIPWNYDIISYQADLDLTDKENLFIDGSCTITFNVINLNNDIPFLIGLANLNITSLNLNGNDVLNNTTKINTTITIDDIFNLLLESDNKLVINYQGTMTSEPGSMRWGGVHYNQGILYAMGVGFNAPYVSTTRHWLPCFDHPQDKATFLLKFKVKPNDLAVSTGELLGMGIGNNHTTYIYSTDIPTATYLVTFAVGPLKNHLVIDQPVVQDVYYLQGEEEKVQQVFKRLPEMMECYSDLFGAFSFEKVSYIITDKGAMEHQTLINYPRASLNSNFNSNDTIGRTIAHELAHHWFGNLVTCKSFSDAWLNESFATFCETLWLENIGGEERYWNDIRSKSDSYLRGIANQEKVLPLFNFPRANPSSNYPATIYQKGAVVLSLLRFQIGGEIFFSAMNKYLNKYKFQTATTEELKAILEAEAKENLDFFFNQWVYGIGWPVVQYNIIQEEDGIYIEFNQIQDQIWQTFTNVPFEINFTFEDGVEGNTILHLNQKLEKLYLGDNINGSSIKFNSKNFYSMINFVNVTNVKNARDYGYIVFPNPASHEFIIDSENKQLTKIKIFDAIGNLVFDDTMQKGEIKLNATDFPNGLYLVIFETDTNKYIEKLIIRK
jgi:aminopeptidase N